jgi:ceramide glucosyltransferase
MSLVPGLAASCSLTFSWFFPVASLSLLTLVSGLLFLLVLAAICYYCFAIYAAIDFFRHPSKPNSDFHPPVSVLKPICGLDGSAYETLASFCRQDYPTYQIIFGIQSAHDPSVVVVRQLIRDFPDIDIRYVISDQTIGVNPKVSNLANAISKAKYDILVLADSDIRVEPDYLRQVVHPFRHTSVGVVTCMYRSLPETWLSAFEALSISTEFMPSVLVAREVEGVSFALGATIAIRRTTLEAIGGFAAIANYLEDDFQLGKKPAQLGYQVVLSDYVVDHVMSTKTISAFIHHQLRWARGTRYARPWGYLGLIFTYGTVASLLFWLTTGGTALGWGMLGITLTLRLTMAWVVAIQKFQDPVAKQLLWLVPLRDIVAFLFWCSSYFGNTIEWRGREFEISNGGYLVELTPLHASNSIISMASSGSDEDPSRVKTPSEECVDL